MNDVHPVKTVIVVAAVALGAAVLVTATHRFSEERIEGNERQRLLASLRSVLGPSLRDAPLDAVDLTVADQGLLGTGDSTQVFVMLDGGAPRALVFTPVATEGYNGPIRLLVGVSLDQRVTGVRVVSHRETPGLGDAIEIDKSDWIRQFDGKSLGKPDLAAWSVDKDGGSFDSLTGATVTPRAVVAAVKNTLLFCEANARQILLEARAEHAREADRG